MAHTLRRLAVAALASYFAVAAAPISAQTTLPSRTAQDVEASFRLLAGTAYRQVDSQAILDAARTGLAQYAHDHGVSAAIPQIRDTGDDSRALTELDDAISNAAAAVHGDATAYAYAAIQGMAQEIGRAHV